MMIFRMIEFFCQISITIVIVLLLQINIKGKTIESYFLFFLNKSKTFEPVREIASSIYLGESDVLVQKQKDKKEQSSPKDQILNNLKNNQNRNPKSVTNSQFLDSNSENKPIDSNKLILDTIMPILTNKLSILQKIVPNNSLEKGVKELKKDVAKIQQSGETQENSTVESTKMESEAKSEESNENSIKKVIEQKTDETNDNPNQGREEGRSI